jgi:hypothetical protein
MTALMPVEVQITVGVGMHADVHVAAALDQMGRLLANPVGAVDTSGFPSSGRLGRPIGDCRAIWHRG